jgi:hypothetical protein
MVVTGAAFGEGRRVLSRTAVSRDLGAALDLEPDKIVGTLLDVHAIALLGRHARRRSVWRR